MQLTGWLVGYFPLIIVYSFLCSFLYCILIKDCAHVKQITNSGESNKSEQNRENECLLVLPITTLCMDPSLCAPRRLLKWATLRRLFNASCLRRGTDEDGPRFQEVGEEETVPNATLSPQEWALRWAVMRAILLFH